MSSYCIVFCTCAPLTKAKEIAKQVIELKLAACVTILPEVHSFFYWEGKETEEKESLLFIKTREEKWPALEAALLRLHPYAVPEIVAVPILKGHPAYLQWIEASLT